MSNSDFLALFATLAVICCVTTQVWRILALGTSRMPDTVRDLASPTPVEAAYLIGATPLALRVALAGLRSEGLLDGGGLTRSELGSEQLLDPLQAAILTAIELSQEVWPNPQVAAAVSALQSSLRDRGLLLSRRRRALVAAAVTPLAVVACLGSLRLIDTASSGPLDWALVAGDAVVIALCLAILATTPRRTRLGIGLTQVPEASYPAGGRLGHSTSREPSTSRERSTSREPSTLR